LRWRGEESMRRKLWRIGEWRHRRHLREGRGRRRRRRGGG